MSAIKANHRAIQAYYDAMQSYADLNVEHETGVRTAFIRLLEDTGKTHEWTVITEQGKKAMAQQRRDWRRFVQGVEAITG